MCSSPRPAEEALRLVHVNRVVAVRLLTSTKVMQVVEMILHDVSIALGHHVSGLEAAPSVCVRELSRKIACKE